MLAARTAFAACLLGAAAASAQPAPTGPQPVSAQPPAGMAAPAAPVELTNAADGRKVTIKRGDEIKLVLDINGLSELAWEMEKPAAPTLAQIGERIYVGNSHGTNSYDVLSGGFTVYRFRAEQPGMVALQLSKHSRADGKTLATVHYDVTVE